MSGVLPSLLSTAGRIARQSAGMPLFGIAGWWAPDWSLIVTKKGQSMFVGHYGPAAAIAGNRVKLWHGFIAVQFLDILWAPFVMLGIEHVRIVENFTASNHFDLYDMPYTHSLVMAAFWSLLAGVAYKLIRKSAGITGGVIISVLVFSHWVFDLLMHKPDLALWFGGPKVGFALWDNRPLSVGLEMGLLILGLGIYLSQTHARGIMGKITPAILFALLAVAQIFGNFGPPPESAYMAPQSAITAYFIFAALAAWVDATRQTKS